ncbi:hypothetical protein ACIBCT_35315 [Streptosporangium sp. NPDC050855]|uniref:hypothetical protein n=1 Tax=Streptosporangium sp. NPDC050855 TaxID=3366194 RepID=UPI0037BC2B0A
MARSVPRHDNARMIMWTAHEAVNNTSDLVDGARAALAYVSTHIGDAPGQSRDELLNDAVAVLSLHLALHTIAEKYK